MRKYHTRTHIRQSILASIVIYLLFSFAFWDITIIKRIPEISIGDRVMLLFIFAAKELFLILLNWDKLFKSKK